MRHLPRALVIAAGISVSVAGSAPGEAEEIHVCADAKGNVVHQTDPCAEPKPAIAVPPPPLSKRVEDRAAAPRGTDPRFDSPERTWKTFAAAVRSGDRAAVLECLTSSALAEQGSRAESLRLDELLATVDAITRVASEGEVGPFWAIRGDRGDAPPKWIFLERTAKGDWKIAAI